MWLNSQKTLQRAGITPNNSVENEANGYQFQEAFDAIVSSFAKQYADHSRKILISNNADPSLSEFTSQSLTNGTRLAAIDKNVFATGG